MGKYFAIAAGMIALMLLVAIRRQATVIEGLHTDLIVAEQSIIVLQTADTAKDKTLDALRQELTARDAALAERDRTVAMIDRQRSAALRALKEAIRDDRQTTAWADTPVPGAMLGLLQ